MALVHITAEDRGKPVTLHVGDELVVRLPENPTTGYRWQVDSSGGILFCLLRDDFEPPGTIAAGAGGMRILQFRAAAAGESSLNLDLRREWGVDKPADHFSVSVVVHP